MTDIENRARRAGAALRTWAGRTPTAAATTVAAQAVRRTRRRTAAGAALLGAVAVVGLVWSPGDDGDHTRIGPATPSTSDTRPAAGDTRPSTTEPRDTGPTSTAGTPGSTTSSTPSTAPDTTAVAPSSAPPVSGGCSGQAGGITYEVALPGGWYANNAWEDVPACRYFGDEPVELRRAESESDHGTVSSNAAVRLYLPYDPRIPPPGTFDERMADAESQADVLDVRRTTISGRPAVRIERTDSSGDGEQGGAPYVTWYIDLGTVEVDVTASGEAAAELDAIARSLRFSG